MPRNYQMTWDPALSPRPLGIGGVWTLDFRDEFEGSVVDQSKWQILDPALPWVHPGDSFANTSDFGNVTWRQANLGVASSVLTLTLDNSAGTQYGGGLVSLANQGLGFHEARIKLVSGWSAWWMATHDMGTGTDPEDPAVYGTEIDLAEARAFAGAPQNVQHAVHWNGYDVGRHQFSEHPTAINDGGWHTIGLWWTPTFYKFYVDGALEWTFTTAISQNPHQYMILNNAYSPGGETAGVAYVDYVRHWVGG